jgi:hypothetical protein
MADPRAAMKVEERAEKMECWSDGQMDSLTVVGTVVV